MVRRDFFHFAAWWLVAVFLEAFFRLPYRLQPNFFLIPPLIVFLRNRHLSVAYLFLFSGLAADVLTGAKFGASGGSFFIVFFFGWFLTEFFSFGNRWHFFMFGLAISLFQNLTRILIIQVFEELNFWPIFFEEVLLRILLTAILIMFCGPLVLQEKIHTSNIHA